MKLSGKLAAIYGLAMMGLALNQAHNDFKIADNAPVRGRVYDPRPVGWVKKKKKPLGSRKLTKKQRNKLKNK